MALFLKRDTRVYLRKTVGAVSAIWEIPVLDGFSFSQGNTTSEVTLNEMANASGYSKRGRRAFNDALAPAEWSFSTYIRPFKSTTSYSSSATTGTGAGGSNNHHAIEEMLWGNFVGKAGWTTSATGILTATAVIAGGVNGTYEVDQGEYTTNGSGFGATFLITVTGPTAATVAIINPGTGYAAGNTITIPGSVLGGAISCTVTVGTLTASETTAYDGEIENFTRDTTDLNISFAGSGTVELGTFDLFFVMGASQATSLNYTASSTIEIFKLTDCVVNEATINFEVDGIAMIDWSGNAATLTMESTLNAGAAITEGVNSTNNFIRNKLTALSLVANTGATRTAFPGAATNGVYNITLTGGSITFSNNITFLTPETLGIVNTPIGHITGNKSVSGNFTAYLDVGVNGDSGSLFEHATSAAAKSIVTNSFATTFRIGGTSGLPRMEISLPTAHLAIPSIQSEDVIAVDIAFEGLPS
jgi:hypothetical protein